jgi:predicted nuclease of predicted toxin-antitoxin system
MKLLLDMNLSDDWCEALVKASHLAIHWSTVGQHNATDKEIMGYAKANSYTVFTQDLDFTDLLAMSGDSSPSVLQLRDDNRLTEQNLTFVLRALSEFSDELEQGALVTVSSRGARAKVLPIVMKKDEQTE